MDYAREPKHPYHRGRPKSECSVCSSEAEAYYSAQNAALDGDGVLFIPGAGYFHSWKDLGRIPNPDDNNHNNHSTDMATRSDGSPVGGFIDATGSMV
jgi:hypothetical protein